VTTGAWTAGAVEEVMKSPDKMSRASPVPMVGCSRGEREGSINIMHLLMSLSPICISFVKAQHNNLYSLKVNLSQSHLRFRSRQFFEFLLIKPVLWRQCVLPLSNKYTLLLLQFVLL